MAVALTISETLNGASASDSLAGGGTGVDLGVVANGSFAPISDKTNNVGRQNLYVRHDGGDDIVDVKFFLGEFGLLSGYSYGGQRTAGFDINHILGAGSASGNSKNNLDGLSGGIWLDQRAFASNTDQFDVTNFPTKVSKFSNTIGNSLVSAVELITDAMVYDNAGTETAASSPIAGVIGASANAATRGNNAHLLLRTYVPLAELEGGVFQFEFIIAYTYTA